MYGICNYPWSFDFGDFELFEKEHHLNQSAVYFGARKHVNFQRCKCAHNYPSVINIIWLLFFSTRLL